MAWGRIGKLLIRLALLFTFRGRIVPGPSERSNTIQGRLTTYLGMRELPRDMSGFALQAFFTCSPTERARIEAQR